MQPLLSIRSIPVNLEYQVTRASLQYVQPRPTANVTRIRGKSEIRTEPVRVKIDTFETRASAGRKSPRRSLEEFGSAGRQAGYEAVRSYAEAGNQIMDSRGKGNPAVDIAAARAFRTYPTVMTHIPSVRPEISFEGGTISFDYTMDRLDYEWNISVRPQVEFIPGEFHVQVTQYPRVEIEYLGGPCYVPPSADPDYDPPPGLDASA